MIRFDNVTLYRGGRAILHDVSFCVQLRQKVALVGANGTGKSSLFSLITKELQADAGDIAVQGYQQQASVAQETSAVEQTAIDFVIDGDTQFRSIEKQLEIAEQEQDGHQIALLHGELDSVNAYSIRARAAELLVGLGFSVAEHSLPVSSFSGGWRMRLYLAQALFCPSDLLLLDEPTNHLDLETVIWLTQYLQKYCGTLLLISHDREFIDSICNVILHIENNKVGQYSGDYSSFEQQRAEKLAQNEALQKNQQTQMAHLQSFIDRFKAKATKAKQAQSRVKALERMQNIVPAHVDSPFHFTFRDAPKAPNPILNLVDATLGYAEHVVLSAINLQLRPGQRIGLLGVNGAGKSTLIKSIVGDLGLLSGLRQQGDGARVGYFAQHQIEQLDYFASPLLQLQRLAGSEREQVLLNYLGGFGFSGDKAVNDIQGFSGGEKARLALSLIIWQQPNLLLLDEPTNHLDIEMRQTLTNAIQDFTGAVLVVSHDRFLLSATADEFWLVAHGGLREFDGDLDDYQRWVADNNKSKDLLLDTKSDNKNISRKEQKQLEAEKRKKLAPINNKIKKIDRKIEEVAGEMEQIEAALIEPDLYGDTNKEKLKKILAQQVTLKASKEELEMEWFELHEELESFENIL